MKTRAAIRVAIPGVCFAAAWIITRSLHPAPAAAWQMIPAKATPEPNRESIRPSEAAQKITAALQSAPSGKWQAVWAEFAASATAAELIAVATGDAGMAKNLAWEELAARRPEMLPVLARRPGGESALIAAAAALAERDPDAALKFVSQTWSSAVQHAVLATIAWQSPETAHRYAEKLAPIAERNSDDEPASRASIAAAWTRRDPEAAAAAGLADSAMWVRVDAVAALQHLLSRNSTDGYQPALWMVAAALRQSPAAAVRLIETNPILREVCVEAPSISYGASMLARWYNVSPESCLAAVEVAAAKSPAMKPGLLHIVASISPDAAAALADWFPEFDLTAWQQRRSMREPEPALDFDPVAAADALLAALDQHPPAEAMTAAGLDAYQAAKLTDLLAWQLPDKARALAAKVSREAFDAQPEAFPFVARSVMDLLWPPDSSDASETVDTGMSYHGIYAMLSGDPARYAATCDPAGNDGWAAHNIVINWAPHDLPAASAWIRSVPDGPPKQRAEAALAMELAVQNPPAGLAAMATVPESTWTELGGDTAAGAWLNALHHIALTAGDWQEWQAKTPAPLRDRVKMLARDALETDAALLAVLRGKR